MRDWSDAERTRNRRLAGAAGLAVGLHALLFLCLLPILLPHLPQAASGRGAEASGGAFQNGALLVADVVLRVPQASEAVAAPLVVPAPTPAAAVVEPVPEPETASGLGPAASGGTPAAGAGSGESGPGTAPGASGDGDGATAVPTEMALKPRIYVQPRIPEDVVRKRKIDDFVLLQVLVGTDGSVRDVRVLRAIANCSECTESAIETARRYRYEPVTIDGRAVEMWTVPFSLRFSDRR